jgi:hypothetical protein
VDDAPDVFDPLAGQRRQAQPDGTTTSPTICASWKEIELRPCWRRRSRSGRPRPRGAGRDRPKTAAKLANLRRVDSAERGEDGVLGERARLSGEGDASGARPPAPPPRPR